MTLPKYLESFFVDVTLTLIVLAVPFAGSAGKVLKPSPKRGSERGDGVRNSEGWVAADSGVEADELVRKDGSGVVGRSGPESGSTTTRTGDRECRAYGAVGWL